MPARSTAAGTVLMFVAFIGGAGETSAHNHYALTEDHETNSWRRAAGRPVPTVHGGSKALIWSCHERVGIGNNLGAFTHAMREALEGDRALVITSLILHKFCEMVGCHWRLLGDYRRRPGDHFVNHLNQGSDEGNDRPNGLLSDPMAAYYNISGCSVAPPGVRLDYWWRKNCLYSRLIRSLVIGGPGGRIQKEKAWLRK